MTGSRVLYDDVEVVTDVIKETIGSRRYGDLLFRRRKQAEHLRSVALEAGWDDWLRVRDGSELEEELRRAEQVEGANHYLLLPSRIGWDVDTPALRQFLQALRLAEENVVARSGDLLVVSFARAELPLVIALRARGRLADLRSRDHPQFADLELPVEVFDLSRADEFLTYLTNAFQTRHFNRISYSERSIQKWSADKEKLLREFTFLKLVPEDLKPYFAHAYGFHEELDGASYCLERYYVPDAAVQWVHESIDERACRILLGRLRMFLSERPRVNVEPERARLIASGLYRDKVAMRLAQLREADEYRDVEYAISLAAGGATLDELFERYCRLYDDDARGRTFQSLAFTHGDLCLSNILFDRDTRVVKFIDCRGALNEEATYSDEYYDLAKLSHSFLGGYDWINNGLADLIADDDLKLNVVMGGGEQGPQRLMFRQMVMALGYSIRRVRLYEASLFLSMLPLHIDHPRKIVQFTAIAAQLIAALEDRNGDGFEDC